MATQAVKRESWVLKERGSRLTTSLLQVPVEIKTDKIGAAARLTSRLLLIATTPSCVP